MPKYTASSTSYFRTVTSQVAIFFLTIFVFPFVIHAQTATPSAALEVTASDIAITLPFSGESQNGDVICMGKDGYKHCDKTYDSAMYGVISPSPAAAIGSLDDPGQVLAVFRGRAKVRVTASNGPISIGDLITSSATPGVAQVAKQDGYVLGRALQDFKPENENDTGLITVSLAIIANTSFGGSRTNILENIRQALAAPTIAPLASLRYLLAFMITLIAFTLGFVYFGRVTRAGVEAIGRNPLASRAIGISIMLHIVLNMIIIAAGVFLSYLILVL